MFLMLYRWMFLLLPFFGSTTFSKPHAHPFYVSVVEVNHNAKAAALEVSCKLFAEDAEAALEKDYKTAIDFSQAAQKSKIDGVLADYVQKHLQVQADKRGQSLKYLGFERDAESLYCYLEADNVPSVKTIDLTNSLLYDFTDKQINIMHVMVGGVRKSFKLDYPNTAASFAF